MNNPNLEYTKDSPEKKLAEKREQFKSQEFAKNSLNINP